MAQTTRTLKGNARLYLEACKAKPGPKVGQALGPLGLNMMEVCRSFNAQTTAAGFKPDIPLRVYVSAYEDRTFDMHFKSPSSTYFFFKACNLTKGANTPGSEVVGEIDLRQIYHIAKVKRRIDPDLKRLSLKGVVKCLVGTARSIGLEIINPMEEYSLVEVEDDERTSQDEGSSESGSDFNFVASSDDPDEEYPGTDDEPDWEREEFVRYGDEESLMQLAKLIHGRREDLDFRALEKLMEGGFFFGGKPMTYFDYAKESLNTERALEEPDVYRVAVQMAMINFPKEFRDAKKQCLAEFKQRPKPVMVNGKLFDPFNKLPRGSTLNLRPTVLKPVIIDWKELLSEKTWKEVPEKYAYLNHLARIHEIDEIAPAKEPKFTKFNHRDYVGLYYASDDLHLLKPKVEKPNPKEARRKARIPSHKRK